METKHFDICEWVDELGEFLPLPRFVEAANVTDAEAKARKVLAGMGAKAGTEYCVVSGRSMMNFVFGDTCSCCGAKGDDEAVMCQPGCPVL